jgi:hypothetical protein
MKHSNWKAAIRKYSLESNGLSNADGLVVKDSFVGQANFVGESVSNADGNVMGGDMFSRISDGNKYYTIVASNTNTSTSTTAVAFGANQYSGSEQPSGVTATVTVAQSSHAEARAASQNSPFWVNGLRYITTTLTQLNSNVLTIQTRYSNGLINSIPFNPLVFKTANQNQSLQIDAPGFKFGIDGNTSIQIPLIASESITLILQVGGRFDAAKAVQGQSAIEVANQRELTSGLVQVVR